MPHINFDKSGNYKVHILCSGETTHDQYRCRDLDDCEIEISDLVYNKGYKKGSEACFDFDIILELKFLLLSILNPSVPSGKNVEFRNDLLSEYYDNYSEDYTELEEYASKVIEFDLYFNVLE